MDYNCLHNGGVRIIQASLFVRKGKNLVVLWTETYGDRVSSDSQNKEKILYGGLRTLLK